MVSKSNKRDLTPSINMTIANTVYRGVEGAVVKVPVEISSELGPKEVLIKITHSSLCYSDVHMIPSGAALGHEGVGIVEKIGREVTTLKVGDRAGGGYLRNVSICQIEQFNASLTKWLLELWSLPLLHQGQRHLLLRAKYIWRSRF